MGNLTLANQLTILRIMLIPVFVLLVVYGFLGWALVVFLVAGPVGTARAAAPGRAEAQLRGAVLGLVEDREDEEGSLEIAQS